MSNTKEFSIKTKLEKNVSILYLDGFLDAYTSEILEQEIAKNVSNGNYNILLNLSNLTYISSAGLGVFMIYIEQIRKNKGDIIMSHLTSAVLEVMNLLGFDEIFKIVATDEEAIMLFETKENNGNLYKD